MRMGKVALNGANMKDKEQLHTYLARRLMLPEWYGRNLDALYDLLTEPGLHLQVVLYNADKAKNLPEGYGEALLETLRDAAKENEHFIFEEV